MAENTIPEYLSDDYFLEPEAPEVHVPSNGDSLAAQSAIAKAGDTADIGAIDLILRSEKDLLERNGLSYTREEVNTLKNKRDIEAMKAEIKSAPEQAQELIARFMEKPENEVDEKALEKETVEAIAWDVDSARKEAAVNNLHFQNTLAESLAKIKDEMGIDDVVFNIGKAIFLPGWNTASINKSIASALGEDKPGFFSRRFTTQKELVQKFRDTLIQSSPEQRETLLKTYLDVLKKESSLFGDEDQAVMSHGINLLLNATDLEQQMDTALNVIDGVTMPGIATLLTLAKKGATNAAVLAKLGKPDEASKVIGIDIVDGTKYSGLSADEIIEEAVSIYKNPLQYSVLEMEGLSSGIKASIKQFETSRAFRELQEFEGTAGLNSEEIAKGLEISMKKYTGEDVHKAEFVDFDDVGVNISVEWQSPKGRPFYTPEEARRYAKDHGWKDNEYEIIAKDSKEIAPSSDGVPFSDYYIKKTDRTKFDHRALTDITVDDVDKIGIVRFFPGIDPKQSILKQVVDSRVISVHQEAKIRNNFTSLVNEAFKHTDRVGRKRVMLALIDGDAVSNAGKRGHVFTPSELASRKLSPVEQDAYYKMREIRNLSYHMHNKMLVDSLNFDGWKSWQFKGNAFFDPFENGAKHLDADTAKSLHTQKDYTSAVDINTGKTVEITSEIIDDLYKDGNVILKTLDEVGLNNNKYNYVIAKVDDAKLGDWSNPLNYRNGEFSRIYTDPYFGYMEFKGSSNGISKAMSRTLVTAPTKREAKEWAKNHNRAMEIIRYAVSKEGVGFTGRDVVRALSKYVDNPSEFLQAVNKGEIPLDAKFNAKFDRDSAGFGADRIQEHLSNGRLFSSQRGEHLLSVRGGDAPTKNPIDSFAHELGFISRYSNLELWKKANIEKFMNSVGKNILIDPNKSMFENFVDGKLLYKAGSKERLYFERLRKYIKTQLGVKTHEQELLGRVGLSFAEWLEGVPWVGSALHKGALMARHKDPIIALRALNFHTTLGMGNIAQLMVQASGSFIAASVHPIHGLKAAKAVPLYRMALMTDNPKALDRIWAMNKTFNLGFGSKKEFFDTVEAMRNSGILDSIHSTALYDVTDGALDFGAGAAQLTKGAFKSTFNTLGHGIKKTGQKGLWFFDRGEEFMRMVSWDIAKREWVKMRAKKGLSTDFTTKAARDEITKRMDDYMIGMTTANKAAWQQGALSIPFQFAQYPLKLMSSLIGKGSFTKAEKFKILAGQTLLFGAAGFPMGRIILDEILGEDAKEYSQEQRLAMTQGILSYLIYAATSDEDQEGLSLAIGQRVGFGQTFTDAFRHVIQDDSTTARGIVLGPTEGLWNRAVKVYGDLHAMFSRNEDLTMDEFTAGLSKLGEIAVSWKNTTKLIAAANMDNYLRSNKGTRLTALDGRELVARFLGMPSTKETELWELTRARQQYDDALEEMATAHTQLSLLKMEAMAAGNDKLADEYQKQMNVLTSTMLTYPQWRRVMQRTRQRLPGESKFDKILRDLDNRARESGEEIKIETFSPER